jgi:hypothetical protein
MGLAMQSSAPGNGISVEWLRNYARANRLDNIVVVHTPPPPFNPNLLRRIAVISVAT